MNFNLTVNDSVKEIFYGIKITTENFEEVYISSSYIDSVELIASNLKNEYEAVMIFFNRDFLQEKKTAMERLQNRKDITYIDILFKDGSENIEIEVPYEEDKNGFNILQSIDNLPKGEIVLQVTKNNGGLQ